MKIYTKTGDQGDTGLFGGPRVRKDDARIEAYGTVDELNAVLGQVRAEGVSAEMDGLLAGIQNDLFDVGAELATPDTTNRKIPTVDDSSITRLELAIDRYELTLPPLRQFILPGGCAAAAALHVARTVCRRAERRLVTLMQKPAERVPQNVLVYLNRLSDLLFVLARAANHEASVPDVAWEQKPSTPSLPPPTP